MPSTPLAGLPYPSGAASPAAAADIMALALAIDAGGLLTAVDEADRDARYAAAPKGTLVTSADSQALWLKLADATATWAVAWQAAQDWTPIALSAGLRARAGYYVPAVRVTGQKVETRGAFETAGGSDIASGTVIGTLTIGKPAASVSVPVASAFNAVGVDVAARRLDVATTGELVLQGYNEGPWASLDGCEWETD